MIIDSYTYMYIQYHIPHYFMQIAECWYYYLLTPLNPPTLTTPNPPLPITPLLANTKVSVTRQQLIFTDVQAIMNSL